MCQRRKWDRPSGDTLAENQGLVNWSLKNLAFEHALLDMPSAMIAVYIGQIIQCTYFSPGRLQPADISILNTLSAKPCYKTLHPVCSNP
jgi:hypothetical protein